jgi:uncharacterized cupredoxin-like copper-binding protein
MSRASAIVIAIAFAFALGACGGDGHSSHDAGGTTIDIDMVDNDFSRPSIEVKAGEQVQFVFHNKGAVTHDAFIGDEAAQAQHEQEMRADTASSASGASAHGHDADAITVAPGQTGTLTHTFDAPGTTIIGCHELNHYALGMRIRVTVT